MIDPVDRDFNAWSRLQSTVDNWSDMREEKCVACGSPDLKCQHALVCSAESWKDFDCARWQDLVVSICEHCSFEECEKPFTWATPDCHLWLMAHNS